jgi:hypothetical protein
MGPAFTMKTGFTRRGGFEGRTSRSTEGSDRMRQSGYAVYSPRRVCLRHERRERDHAGNRPSLNEAYLLLVRCCCVGKKTTLTDSIATHQAEVG